MYVCVLHFLYDCLTIKDCRKLSYNSRVQILFRAQWFENKTSLSCFDFGQERSITVFLLLASRNNIRTSIDAIRCSAMHIHGFSLTILESVAMFAFRTCNPFHLIVIKRWLCTQSSHYLVERRWKSIKI